MEKDDPSIIEKAEEAEDILKTSEDVKKKYPTCNFAFILDETNSENVLKRVIVDEFPAHKNVESNILGIVPYPVWRSDDPNNITVKFGGYTYSHYPDCYFTKHAPLKLINLMTNIEFNYAARYTRNGYNVEYNNKTLAYEEYGSSKEKLVCWNTEWSKTLYDDPEGGSGGA